MEDQPHVSLVDALALRDHWATPAVEPTIAIAERLWPALRALGAPEGGQMLVTGMDAHLFSRMTPLLDGEPTWGIDIAHTAAIPAPDGHTDLPVHAFQEGQALDVVVCNSLYSDVRLHDPDFDSQRALDHIRSVLSALRRTNPGGLTAAIVAHTVLDSTDLSAAREAMTELGDLLGAVRLPGGLLRATAGCDLPTDLLVFRARGPHSVASGESIIRTARRATIPDLPAFTEYFHRHSNHVLGDLEPHHNPYGQPMLAVSTPRDVWERLTSTLDQIVARHAPVGPDEPSTLPTPAVSKAAMPDGGRDSGVGQAPVADQGPEPAVADYVRRRANPAYTPRATRIPDVGPQVRGGEPRPELPPPTL